MTQRHKHADTIIAWANGAKIQIENTDGLWVDWDISIAPGWGNKNNYRTKPEPKVVYGHVKPLRADYPQGLNVVGFCDLGPLQITTEQTHVDNIKFTFDGETGVLKSVEMLK